MKSFLRTRTVKLGMTAAFYTMIASTHPLAQGVGIGGVSVGVGSGGVSVGGASVGTGGVSAGIGGTSVSTGGVSAGIGSTSASTGGTSVSIGGVSAGIGSTSASTGSTSANIGGTSASSAGISAASVSSGGVDTGLGGSSISSGESSSSIGAGGIGVRDARETASRRAFDSLVAEVKILLRCKENFCSKYAKFDSAARDLGIRRKARLLSGCEQVFLTPMQFSRDTLEICKIVASL